MSEIRGRGRVDLGVWALVFGLISREVGDFVPDSDGCFELRADARLPLLKLDALCGVLGLFDLSVQAFLLIVAEIDLAAFAASATLLLREPLVDSAIKILAVVQVDAGVV